MREMRVSFAVEFVYELDREAIRTCAGANADGAKSTKNSSERLRVQSPE